ncbi:type I DNA topoisomerase [Traorella massiliensis]|uniref:type I DNA topoisomerase n=1 Tax=Traorella massiliensis TaxID=1903263 RepID=UPI0023533A82|nr:type I DNA topoisomerase [Traorella massiliensis]
MKKLVIVESPSKSRTIEKYLGNDYKVVSSKGHIRDLATSGKGGLGIDIENHFTPTYVISKDKKETVKELKETAKKCSEIYLASDPDREGEAIAWHLAEVLEVDKDQKNRVIFNEITKNAVIEAFKSPRTIDMDLVKSQETRRMLDRIIGFKLSGLLQNKIKSKSAGRVQSVALNLIVEREKEIQAFKSEEYWTIDALVTKNNKKFKASLNKVHGKKIKIKNEEEAKAIENACNGDYVITKIDKKVKKKQPRLPFITSTLQQEASTKLNFSSKKTMSIAQKLYEGISIKGNHEGLITYMRSDSTRLSDVFVKEAFDYIEKEYGKKYVGKVHQKNNKNAQDAHEAIRVTHIDYTPDSIKEDLTNDEYKLYKLIYARSIAYLMAPSQSDSVSVTIENEGHEFNASGSVLTFDGYLKAYKDYEQNKDEVLPEMSEQEVLKNVSLERKQHFTEPPLRYSEARLIKEMEEKGIGRPSTYASIIDTIQKRLYVELVKSNENSKTKVFIPTEQGFLTDAKLQEYFSSIINVSYTANMEKDLDEIAEGKKESYTELKEFYDKFVPLLDEAYEKMEKLAPQKTGELCPECGSELVYRNGKYGRFISCSNFPACKYTKSENEEETQSEETCPNCGSPMVMKKGRYGSFLACSNYPKCKTIKKINAPKEEPKATGEMCPECGKPLIERKSRYGTTFVGCSGFPKCHYIKKQPKKKKGEENE